ncbi:MAG: hypothetical protein OEZ39_14680 [Gammaproteobacteria bacterium]|nr:hypothetical protein [Gammaproteobacteria bacterium]MDH5653099.1 hypothetical protein [Gammaproteobacteria bacterium]
MYDQRYILRDCFGRLYKLATPYDRPAPVAVEAELFFDPVLTQERLQDFDVSMERWRQLVDINDLQSGQPVSDQAVPAKMSELLIQGRYRLYPITEADRFIHPPQKRTIETSDKTRYLFTPASTLLISRPPEVKTFNRKEDAKAFINSLNADEAQLQTIATELSLPKQTNKSGADTLIERLSRHLATGKVVIVVSKTGGGPKQEKQAETEHSQVGHRPVDLGPHESGDTPNHSDTNNEATSQEKTFHTQEKSNSCVIASSRNIIEQKTGQNIPESDLRQQMKEIMNNPNHNFETNGINPIYAQELLKQNGVNSTTKSGLTLDELQTHTAETPVLIGFKNPGHRVILDSVEVDSSGNKTYVVQDPDPRYQGRPRRMTESEFSNKYNERAIVIIPE